MNISLKQLLCVKLEKPWTPEQALAIHEFLTGLADTIWRRYEDDIFDSCPDMELAQHHYQHQYCENRVEDFDDNFPF